MVLLLLGLIVGCRASFSEEVLLKPLRGGALATHFQFTSRLHVGQQDSADQFVFSTGFPQPISRLVHSLGLDELSLTFTGGGRWQERWGPPMQHHHAPSGVALHAAFRSETAAAAVVSSVDERWGRLKSALAGLFCA